MKRFFKLFAFAGIVLAFSFQNISYAAGAAAAAASAGADEAGAARPALPISRIYGLLSENPRFRATVAEHFDPGVADAVFGDGETFEGSFRALPGNFIIW